MKRKLSSMGRVAIALVLAVSLMLVMAVPVYAGAPTVALTPDAGIDSLTGAPTASGTEAGVHTIVVSDATASTLTGVIVEHDTDSTIATSFAGSEVLTVTIATEAITTLALASTTAGTTTLAVVAADIEALINAQLTLTTVTVSVVDPTAGIDGYFVITVDEAGANNSIVGNVTDTGATPTGLGTNAGVAGTDADAVDSFAAATGSNGLWVAWAGGTSKTIAHSPAAGTASTLAGLEPLVEAADAFVEGVTLVASTLTTGTPVVTVSAGTAGHLKVTGATGTPTAGANNELTVTAYDDADNRATAYASSQTLTFSGPSTAPDGTSVPDVEGTDIGTSQSVTFSNGIANGTNLTLIAYKAETTTVDVSDGTINSTADDTYDLDLVVSPKAIDHFVLVTQNAGTEVAGVAFSITLTAEDQYDNTATGFNSSTENITFTKTATNAPDGTTPTVNSETIDFSSPAGIATSTGFILVNAGETPTITGTEGGTSKFGATAAITVNAAAFAEYTVVPASTNQVAGTAFTVTTTAVDEFQNPSPSGITDATLNGYTFAFTGPANAPNSTAPTYPTTASFSSGVWAATNGVTLVKVESSTLTVTDNQGSPMSGTSASITVAHGATDSLAVTGITDPIVKGASSNVTVEALDAYENRATGYGGTVTFTSTATSALPSDSGLSSGIQTFSAGVTFDTVGQQSVTATDTGTSSITGTQSGIGVYDVLITLATAGWTLISTDDYIISTGSDTSVFEGSVTLKFVYTGSSYVTATVASITPVEALYVKTTGSDGKVGLNYSTTASPGASIKALVAGWNLISSATANEASDVLSPLRYIDVGEAQGVGLTTLVSQATYNITSNNWYADATTWSNLTAANLGQSMNAFDGYWVYMNAAKSFGVIPQ